MSHPLNTIIVDDEALARRGLRHRLADVEDVDVVGEACNGREALDLIRKIKPDLVFLDIQMPGMDGFDVLRGLPEKRMPAIVFVTAFDDYAIQAFEANALDYLLKPIEDSRLSDALDRFRRNLDQKRAVQHRESLLKLVGDITGRAVKSMEEIRAQNIRQLKRREPARLAIKDGSKVTWIPQERIE